MTNSRAFASAIAAALLICSAAVVPAQEAIKPFPQNRVRNFYLEQARHQLSLKDKAPRLLPEFPGLDGGRFGHWGQNPESNNTDNYRNTMDDGGLMTMLVDHFGVTTTKAVTFRVGKNASVLFDPLKLNFIDSWTGGLQYGSSRFGLQNAATPSGPRLFDLSASQWQNADNLSKRYVGFYRNGEKVVFRYVLGELEVYDHVWLEDGALQRTLRLEGNADDLRLDLLRVVNGKCEIEQTDSGYRARLADGDATTVVSVRCGDGVELSSDGKTLGIDLDGAFVRPTVHIGTLRVPSAESAKALARIDAMPVPKVIELTRGGKSRWKDKVAVTQLKLGEGTGPYVIDTLTLPYDKANPFGEPFRIGGFDFQGFKIVVAMLSGDVWTVDGSVDQNSGELTWTRIAAGLFQPLGLITRNQEIYVAGRDQITCLYDLNGDGETDFYECVSNRFPTGGGQAFVTDLHADEAGDLFFYSPLAGVSKLEPESQEPIVLGSGLRNSNGMGVSQDGKIVLATTQEGDWAPATAIFDVGNGCYCGHGGPKKGSGKYGYRFPLCFVPRGIDNSAGSLAWVNDRRWGPLAGAFIGTSFGYCTHYMVLMEKIGDHVQGGVVPLPGEFLSGAHRVRVNPNDGQVYIAGTEGWQSYARENGSLQRVRYVGGEMPLPKHVETRANGLIVRFNEPVDAASVNVANVFAEQWNYLYSEAYGSPEYSVNEPGRRGHDRVDVKSVHLLPDGKSVFVEIPQLHPVMQFHLYMNLKTATGTTFEPDIYYSIFELGEPFTGFPGYAKIAKQRAPDFPIAELYPRDPRLVRQERLGKDFKTLSGVVSLEVNAVGGLMYKPRRLRVPPGQRVALTFKNTDVSMPHNFVLVQPDRLQAIGDGAMMLAADPRAIATHYAPNDPGVICLSPILTGGDQYTIYFDSPTTKGPYPYVCTFPGHWHVMQGTLYVADPGDVLPEEPAEPVRKFVKDWSVADLAADAENLHDRSVERGLQLFHVAGCIKCHVVAGHGTKLGPDLTDVTKRFRGKKLLEQIVDPSTEINKQYRTMAVVTTDGKTMTGLVVKEEPDAIHLLTNPLKPEEISVVNRKTIDEIIPSPISTMPKGLLMTLEKDEILDLLAFLESGGSGHHHGK